MWRMKKETLASFYDLFWKFYLQVYNVDWIRVLEDKK